MTRYSMYYYNNNPTSDRIIYFSVGLSDADRSSRYRLRDEAVAEMQVWCLEQFGPTISNPRAHFESGWYYHDMTFSFSDDRAEWAMVFKMRWM